MMMRGVAAPRAKQLWIMTDAAREARAAGVPFGDIVDPFGEPVKRAFALWSAIVDAGAEQRFLSRYLAAAWAEGVDITTDAGLDAVLVGAGLDPEVVHAEADPDRSTTILDANLETIEVAGQPAWRLSVKLPALTNIGPIQDEIVLRTTDRDGVGEDERLTVPVHGQVVADIGVFPETLSFGMLSQGESGELEAQVLARVPGARVKIVGAEIDGPLAEHVELEYRPVRGDAVGRSKEWRIHMKAAGSIPVGRATGTLNIRLDDAQYPELSAKVLAVVR